MNNIYYIVYRSKLIFLLGTLLILISSCANKGLKSASPGAISTSGKRLVFLSDTQSPFLHEYLLYRHNAKARRIILQDILNRNKSAVFHLGDLVSYMGNDSDWELIDNFTNLLEKDSVPFYPITGNHEYFFSSSKSVHQKFRKKYPDFSEYGYCKIIDGIAVVLLNSNFDKIDGSKLKQNNYYKSVMKKLQDSASVKCIMVACHHPPFTKSLNNKPDEEVLDSFVPKFISTPKAVLFLSGHSHRFEYFKYKEKDFMVIGGGGGLLQYSSSRDFPVAQTVFSNKRHHYIECFISGDTLCIRERRLHDYEEVVDGVEIKIPI